MAVMNCKCNHQGQDQIHGKGQRVFNKTVKGYRCTVCSTDKMGTKVFKAKKR